MCSGIPDDERSHGLLRLLAAAAATASRSGPINWGFIQRGLFLIAVQLVWVNASWGGFTRLRLDHFGIIATIGMSMLLLIWMVRWNWKWRAVAAG